MAKTVTHNQDNESFFGEERLLDKAQNSSFTGMIFELLSEKKPSPEEEKLFELILNLSIDHGEDTPSASETIKAAEEGKSISESLAAGVVQINEHHGGAVEPSMRFLYQVKDGADVQKLVNEYIEQEEIIGGFGHRIYTDVDPRAELILKKLEEAGLGTEFVRIARKVQDAIEANKGVRLVVNVDGAIAVTLCTFGWDPSLGKAVFLIARTPGLCGQYFNNLKTQMSNVKSTS